MSDGNIFTGGDDMHADAGSVTVYEAFVRLVAHRIEVNSEKLEVTEDTLPHFCRAFADSTSENDAVNATKCGSVAADGLFGGVAKELDR